MKQSENRPSTHSRRSASTPGLKLVEFKKSPIIARVNIPDIPTSSPIYKRNKYKVLIYINKLILYKFCPR